MHYAHSTERLDRSDWQPLAEHLRDVAKLAADFAGDFGASRAAALSGWMHDLGKYAPEFQAYIAGKGQSVDHSTAGAQNVLQLVADADAMDKIMAELVAYAIAGHHAGLPDRQGATSAALQGRLTKAIPLLDPVWKSEVKAEASGLLPGRFAPCHDEQRVAFQIAFLGRMIFSCLVDADYLDTERHYARVTGALADREWPRLDEHVASLIARFDDHMDRKLAELAEPQRAAPLNVLRRDILAHVRSKAAMPKGVFTLDVPTGGGKTLASLAFALEHAQVWHMARIVYAIPFTSIIDQTADIFRKVLGDRMVLEHHSQIETERDQEETADQLPSQYPEAKLRRAMENWAAPVVVTTNVQLFESLFSHRPARCRKLHSLANAVIVLDEAQTIPLHVLRPCVAALDELARNYGCTIVLCTATQPALKAPQFRLGFDTARELAPNPEQLHTAFERVTYRMAGELSDEALIAEMCDVSQGLAIVNSRKHARDLYLAAKSAGLQGLIHLTTRQTATDRIEILKDIRHRLKNALPCIVISTSLIEAGVDVSFPRVWRAEAGLDQIIQAAGRCNREWERPKEESFVTVFRPAEAKPPREIEGFAAAMGRVAKDFQEPFSKPAIAKYYSEVYWQRGDSRDKDGLDSIPMPDYDGRRKRDATLKQFLVGGGETDFSYRKVGENFRLIEEGMVPVIITKDDAAKETLRKLHQGWITAGVAARELQRHTVQLPPLFRTKLIENGHAEYIPGFDTQFAVLKTESFYTRDEGLMWEKADELGIEGNMI